MDKHNKPHEFTGKPDAPKMERYTVKAGDTLSGIAQKFYGDASQYKMIYEVNKELIGDNPDLIKVGQELKIPPQMDPK